VQGGYALARPAATISAAEILDALEGPVAITECSSSTGGCELESFCLVGTAWQRINHSIRKALEGVSLADLQQRREQLPNLRTEVRTAALAR
jgi:Rrf2 family protein